MTDPSDFVVVAEYGTDEELKSAGARLLEAGIAPIVDDAPDGHLITGTTKRLLVFPHDHLRACEVLGLPLPETTEPGAVPIVRNLDDPLPERKSFWWSMPDSKTMKILIFGWLLLMVLVPAFAFWITSIVSK